MVEYDMPSPPTIKSSGISFTDIDPNANELGGTVTIGTVSDETKITDYVLYWGLNATTPICVENSSDKMACGHQLTKTGANVQYIIPNDTSIPIINSQKATHLIVYTKDRGMESENSVSLEFLDQ